MNKILIALVLAVVMSGNVYANFILDKLRDIDLFKSEKKMCLEAVVKGKLIRKYENQSYPERNYRFYAYKGETYEFFYIVNKCKKTLY